MNPPEAAQKRSGALREAEITLPGKPMTWARARIAPGRFITAPERESRMVDFATLWVDAGHPRFEEPIEAEIEAVYERPKSHFGTGRNATLVKASAPSRPGRYDVDNIAKLALDGLAAVAFRNDSQVARLVVEKRYCVTGERPQTRVAIRLLA